MDIDILQWFRQFISLNIASGNNNYVHFGLVLYTFIGGFDDVRLCGAALDLTRAPD